MLSDILLSEEVPFAQRWAEEDSDAMSSLPRAHGGWIGLNWTYTRTFPSPPGGRVLKSSPYFDSAQHEWPSAFPLHFDSAQCGRERDIT
jgi:hypothetical protein